MLAAAGLAHAEHRITQRTDTDAARLSQVLGLKTPPTLVSLPSLSSDEHGLAVLLSLAGVAMARSHILPCLTELGVRRASGRAFNNESLDECFAAMATRGLIRFDGFAQSTPELTWSIFLSLPRAGFARAIEVLRRRAPLESGRCERIRREINLALLDRDPGALSRALEWAHLNDRFGFGKGYFVDLPAAALEHIRGTPEVFAMVAADLLRIARRDMCGADELLRELEVAVGDHVPPAFVAHELARHLILRARCDDARSVLEPHRDQPGHSALAAWIAVAKGDFAAASELAQRALDTDAAKGPEIVVCIIVRLAKRASRDGPVAGVRGGGEPGSVLAACLPSMEALEHFLRVGELERHFLPRAAYSYQTPEATAWMSVCVRLLLTLCPSESLAALDSLQRKNSQDLAAAAGLQWLVDALESSAALSGLFTVAPPWERKLQRLEKSVASVKVTPTVKAPAPAAKPADTRLVWILEPARFDLDVHPREQRCDARGNWTKGRRVALERLFGPHPSYEPMTPADKSVCRFIREEVSLSSGYRNVAYSFDGAAAFHHLAAHPCVFWDDGGFQRLSFRESEPSLHVVSDGRELVIRLEPRVQRVGTWLHKTGPHEVTRITARDVHQSLGEILGSGLRVPVSEAARVERIIAAVTGVVAIHSDIGASVGGKLVPPDMRPVIQLTPEGNGMTVRVLVRPLGSDGPALTPGQGASTVTVLRSGHTIVAQRDLAAEIVRVDAVLRACPTLLAGEVGASGDWQLESSATGFELLLELSALGSNIVVEWPAGKPIQVVGTADAQALRLKIDAGSGGWFELSGELSVEADRVLELGELLRLVADSPHRFVALSPGRFVALTERFRDQLAALAKLTHAPKRGGRLALHPWAGSALEPMAEEAGSLKASPLWRKAVAARHEVAQFEPSLPTTLKATLRDYQLDGFRWLARLARLGAGACLADDMGLGKTLQSLALLVHRGANGAQLVVCPTSVIGGWLDEAARFAPTLRCEVFGSGDRARAIAEAGPFDVLLVSHGLLQSEAELLAGREWETVVLDEAQAIKNPDTLRAKAAFGLRAGFRVALTGTPIENRLDDLWSLFQFLVPGLLGTRPSFAERFARPISEARDTTARAALKQLVRPLLLRRTKAEVLQELPERTEMVVHVDLGSEEAALYEALRQRALASLASHAAEPSGQRRLRVLAEITRLRRACCHPRLVLSEGDALAAGMSLASSAKLVALAELVSELRDGGHRALIYSQFVDHLQVVREWLDAQAISYQYLDGGTPQRQRQDRVRAFQAGEGELFLISLRAGGTGLNLTGADFVIHLDPWWNPAVEDQASDRIYRIGQERPVTVVRLIVRASVEERIMALHRSKRELAADLLEGADAAAKLDVDALLALIGSA